MGAPDAARAALGGAQPGHVLAPEAHDAVVGALRAGEHVEQRRLARAVGADDPDGVARRHVERHAVQHDERAELAADVLGAEEGSAWRRA
jgi:hypothetical protein